MEPTVQSANSLLIQDLSVFWLFFLLLNDRAVEDLMDHISQLTRITFWRRTFDCSYRGCISAAWTQQSKNNGWTVLFPGVPFQKKTLNYAKILQRNAGTWNVPLSQMKGKCLCSWWSHQSFLPSVFLLSLEIVGVSVSQQDQTPPEGEKVHLKAEAALKSLTFATCALFLLSFASFVFH